MSKVFEVIMSQRRTCLLVRFQLTSVREENNSGIHHQERLLSRMMGPGLDCSLLKEQSFTRPRSDASLSGLGEDEKGYGESKQKQKTNLVSTTGISLW